MPAPAYSSLDRRLMADGFDHAYRERADLRARELESPGWLERMATMLEADWPGASMVLGYARGLRVIGAELDDERGE